jgi:protein-disulfide isomerase
MPNDPRPTKAQRQADARARAAELRKQQERSAKRGRVIGITVAAVAILGLAGVIVAVTLNSAKTRAEYAQVAFGGDTANVVAPELADVQAPSTADETGGIPISDEGVGVAGEGDAVLSIYFDLQCPACQSFDSLNAADLEALAAEPGITVLYQPLSFLDDTSKGTRYATRAANALMVVADQAPEQFQDFITELYVNQPAENTSGIPDSKIAEIAAGVGVPQVVIDEFTTTVEGTYQVSDADGNLTSQTGSWRRYAPFLAAATSYASEKLGGIATPTLLLDDEEIDPNQVPWSVPGTLAAYVRAAAAA